MAVFMNTCRHLACTDTALVIKDLNCPMTTTMAKATTALGLCAGLPRFAWYGRRDGPESCLVYENTD
eukprot:3623059-Pleurochrysis_carterae.AAC.3